MSDSLTGRGAYDVVVSGGGHIFHGDLSWPWAAGTTALDTPAARWGVATGTAAVLELA